MADLKCKYWKGFLINNGNSPAFLRTWKIQMYAAQNKNEDLVVFAIPKNKDGTYNNDLIEEIEKLLQKNNL